MDIKLPKKNFRINSYTVQCGIDHTKNICACNKIAIKLFDLMYIIMKHDIIYLLL